MTTKIFEDTRLFSYLVEETNDIREEVEFLILLLHEYDLALEVPVDFIRDLSLLELVQVLQTAQKAIKRKLKKHE